MILLPQLPNVWMTAAYPRAWLLVLWLGFSDAWCVLSFNLVMKKSGCLLSLPPLPLGLEGHLYGVHSWDRLPLLCQAYYGLASYPERLEKMRVKVEPGVKGWCLWEIRKSGRDNGEIKEGLTVGRLH